MNKFVRPLASLFALTVIVSTALATAAFADDGLRRFGVPQERVYPLTDLQLADVRRVERENSPISEPALRLLRRPASMGHDLNPTHRRHVQRLAEEIGLPSGSPW